MRTEKQRDHREPVGRCRLDDLCRPAAEVVHQESFGGLAAEDIGHHLGPGELAPAEPVVDARGGGVEGAEEEGFAAAGANVLDGLAAQLGRDAAPAK